MSRKSIQVTKIWCDRCGKEEYESSTTAQVQIYSNGNRKHEATLDFCTGCRTSFQLWRTRANHSGMDVQAVRRWAQEEGIDLPSRGRIPNYVYDAYAKALEHE